MNPISDFDRQLETWLDEGADVAPELFVWEALDRIETTPQRGAWLAPLEGLLMRMQSATPYLAVAAAVVVAVVLYLALASPPVGDADQSPTAAPSGTAAPDASDGPSTAPSAGEVAPRSVQSSAIDAGGHITSLVATDDAVYAVVENRIMRIDPQTAEVALLLEIPDVSSSCGDCIGGPETTFAIGEGSIWIAYHYEGQSVVRRFDLESGAAQAEVTLGNADGGGAGASDVTVAFGSVWSVQCHSGTVARIDPATNQQADLWQVAEGAFCGHPYSIAADAENLWVTMMTDDGVSMRDWILKLDPATGASLGSSVIQRSGSACGRFAIDVTLGVWINSCPASEDSSLIRVAPGVPGAEPGAASLVHLSGYLGSPVIVDGRVWVPRVASRPSGASVLLGVDPESGEVVDAIEIASSTQLTPRTASTMIVAFESVWVGGDDGTLLRIPLAELSR